MISSAVMSFLRGQLNKSSRIWYKGEWPFPHSRFGHFRIQYTKGGWAGLLHHLDGVRFRRTSRLCKFCKYSWSPICLYLALRFWILENISMIEIDFTRTNVPAPSQFLCYSKTEFAFVGTNPQLIYYFQVLSLGTPLPADYKFNSGQRIHKWTILHYSPFKVVIYFQSKQILISEITLRICLTTGVMKWFFTRQNLHFLQSFTVTKLVSQGKQAS